MYTIDRLAKWRVIPLFVLISILLAACGTSVANTNFPGLSVKDNNVYVAYGPQVLAVDVMEEEQIWAYPAEIETQPQYYSSPSVVGGDVIFGDYGQSGGFISASVTVGIYSREDTVEGVPQENWTNTSDATDRIIAGPLQVEDRVFVGTADNKLISFDAQSGRPLWGEPFEAGHAIWGQPTYEDGVLYVGSMDGAMTALDADNGTVLWSVPFDGALAAKPVLGDGVVYVSSYDKHVHALDLDNGDIVWSAPAEDAVWGGPALDQGIVYFADLSGNMFAVDSETGSEIWKVSLGRLVQATPVVDDDRIYVATVGEVGTSTDEWRGSLLALSVQDGSQIWEWSESEAAPIYATPVLVEDRVVTAVQSVDALLIVFDRENGDVIWRFTPEAMAEG